MSSRKASETGDPPAGWEVQAKRGQIPRNEAYIDVRRSDLPCEIGFAVSRGENLTGRGMRVTQQMGVFRQPQMDIWNART